MFKVSPMGVGNDDELPSPLSRVSTGDGISQLC